MTYEWIPISMTWFVVSAIDIRERGGNTIHRSLLCAIAVNISRTVGSLSHVESIYIHEKQSHIFSSISTIKRERVITMHQTLVLIFLLIGGVASNSLSRSNSDRTIFNFFHPMSWKAIRAASTSVWNVWMLLSSESISCSISYWTLVWLTRAVTCAIWWNRRVAPHFSVCSVAWHETR